LTGIPSTILLSLVERTANTRCVHNITKLNGESVPGIQIVEITEKTNINNNNKIHRKHYTLKRRVVTGKRRDLSHANFPLTVLTIFKPVELRLPKCLVLN